MEGGENEVAGLCCSKGELNGLQVAHLPNHDDIGVFSQSSTKSPAEGFGVGVDFALVDVATCRLEDILDRILERENMVLAVMVNEVHEGGEGG